MRFIIDVEPPQQLLLFHENWLSKIAEEVRLVLNTPIGTVPGYRDYGMDMSYVHLPANAAESIYASAAAEAIERFVPSLRVNQVYFPEDEDGVKSLQPTIEVTSYEQT